MVRAHAGLMLSNHPPLCYWDRGAVGKKSGLGSCLCLRNYIPGDSEDLGNHKSHLFLVHRDFYHFDP